MYEARNDASAARSILFKSVIADGEKESEDAEAPLSLLLNSVSVMPSTTAGFTPSTGSLSDFLSYKIK